MGQQQLLLLVLSTVIVGLATVAGIQAFDEGQTQAEQDAVSQRALTVGNDIYAASQTPSQLGGIDIGSTSPNAIASAAGYGDDATSIPVEGVSDANANCKISNDGSITIVECGSEGTSSGEYVTVEVDDSGASIVSINGQSITQ